MIRVIIFFMFLSKVMSVNAQSYIPTIVEGNQWEIRIPHGMNTYTDFAYYLGCDTVIENNTYLKAIHEGRDEVLGLFREDTTAQQIYQWIDSTNSEKVIIDYSLSVGDTIYIWERYLDVDSITYDSIYGKVRKVIHLRGIEKYIEGIGYNWYGITYYLQLFQKITGFNEGLRECGYTLSIEAQEGSKGTIYPNPAQSILYFENFDVPLIEIELIGLQGRTVERYRVTDHLDISHLKTGMYFIKIKGENVYRRFIKL